jgi:hypothetical protein
MRLGLLGPSAGNSTILGRAAEFILRDAHVDRAVYLGDDGVLETTVTEWATRLVGPDPTDDGAFRRAANLALTGNAAQIDRFVVSERARLRLRSLESLPAGDGRSIEMISDRIAILIHDKAMLSEDDIASANLLVYGKSPEPLLKKIGARWFLTPGMLGCKGGGVAVLEDDDDEIRAEIFDEKGARSRMETLDMTRKAHTRVQKG